MRISEEVVFLEEAFDALNERYFESVYSRPVITIQSTPHAHGRFTPYGLLTLCYIICRDGGYFLIFPVFRLLRF